MSNESKFCSAKYCFNSRKTSRSLTFFQFPKDEYRCRKWLENAGRLDLLTKSTEEVHRSTYLLCAEHFEDNQFFSAMKKRLLPFSIPTLFSNIPSGSALELTKKETLATIINKKRKVGEEDSATLLSKRRRNCSLTVDEVADLPATSESTISAAASENRTTVSTIASGNLTVATSDLTAVDTDVSGNLTKAATKSNEPVTPRSELRKNTGVRCLMDSAQRKKRHRIDIGDAHNEWEQVRICMGLSSEGFARLLLQNGKNNRSSERKCDSSTNTDSVACDVSQSTGSLFNTRLGRPRGETSILNHCGGEPPKLPTLMAQNFRPKLVNIGRAQEKWSMYRIERGLTNEEFACLLLDQWTPTSVRENCRPFVTGRKSSASAYMSASSDIMFKQGKFNYTRVPSGATLNEKSKESTLLSDTRNISPSPAPEEMSFQVFTISHEYQVPSDSNTVEVTILPDMPPGSDESENDPVLGSCSSNTNQSPRDLCKDSLLKLVPCGWGTQYVGKELLFTRIHNEVVLMSLRVDCDFRLCLKVCGEELNEDHPLYAPLSNHRISTVHDLISVLVMLNRWTTCLGVRENELVNVSLSVTLVKVKDCRVKWHAMSLHSFACQQIVSTSESKTLCTECKKLESSLSSELKSRNKRCLNSNSTNEDEDYNS